MTRRPSVISIYFSIFLYKFTKIKIKSFECPKSIRNYKKIMLGTSDAWSTCRLSKWTSKLAYYIVDCRIFSVCTVCGFELALLFFEYQVPMFWLYWTSALSKRKMSNMFFCIEGLFHFFQIPFKASSERKQQVASKNRPILYYLDLINYSFYQKTQE